MMKPRERTPAFYWYAFACGLIFAMPLIAFICNYASQRMDVFDKYLALFAIALVVLAYELTHTFNPK